MKTSQWQDGQSGAVFCGKGRMLDHSLTPQVPPSPKSRGVKEQAPLPTPLGGGVQSRPPAGDFTGSGFVRLPTALPSPPHSPPLPFPFLPRGTPALPSCLLFVCQSVSIPR